MLTCPSPWLGRENLNPDLEQTGERSGAVTISAGTGHLKTAELNIMGKLSRPTRPASPRTMMRRNNMSTAIIQSVLRCPVSAADVMKSVHRETEKRTDTTTNQLCPRINHTKKGSMRREMMVTALILAKSGHIETVG